VRFGNDLSPESPYKAIHPEIPLCGIEGLVYLRLAHYDESRVQSKQAV
jgi:hypothetical protein